MRSRSTAVAAFSRPSVFSAFSTRVRWRAPAEEDEDTAKPVADAHEDASPSAPIAARATCAAVRTLSPVMTTHACDDALRWSMTWAVPGFRGDWRQRKPRKAKPRSAVARGG